MERWQTEKATDRSTRPGKTIIHRFHRCTQTPPIPVCLHPSSTRTCVICGSIEFRRPWHSTDTRPAGGDRSVERASVGLPPRPVPETNPTRRIKNEANRSEHRTNPIRRTSKNSARNGTLRSPSLNPHLPRARAWHGPWHSGPHRFAANPILVTGCRKPLLPAPSITYGSEPLSPHRCNPSATTEPQSRPACQVVPRHFAKTAGRGADSQVAQIHTSSSGACPPSSFISENLRSPWIDRCSIHHA